MRNITKNLTCGNVTGFKKIEAVPVNEVVAILMPYYNHYSIELIENGKFGNIEADNITLNQNTENSSEIAIRCLFVSTRDGLNAMFDDMTRNRFIVKLTDNNNIVWGAGTLEEPLRFSFSHTGDPKPAGRHAYTLNFTRNSKKTLYLIAQD